MKELKAVIQLTSIMMILASCIPTTPITNIETVRVLSLREHIPTLLSEAQNWHADAYLESASINLYEQALVRVYAHFQAPTEEYRSFVVKLLPDGTLSTETYDYGKDFPVYHHKPIQDSEWRIDSREALNTLLDYEGAQFLNSGRFNCSNLKLEHFLPYDEQRLVWSLTLSDCSADSPRFFYLDAMTGEKLSLSSSIVPTRFTTPSP